jgi:hypothetical protein
MDETVQKVSYKQSLLISSTGILLIKSEEPSKTVAPILVPILAKIHHTVPKKHPLQIYCGCPFNTGGIEQA